MNDSCMSHPQSSENDFFSSGLPKGGFPGGGFFLNSEKQEKEFTVEREMSKAGEAGKDAHKFGCID